MLPGETHRYGKRKDRVANFAGNAAAAVCRLVFRVHEGTKLPAAVLALPKRADEGIGGPEVGAQRIEPLGDVEDTCLALNGHGWNCYVEWNAGADARRVGSEREICRERVAIAWIAETIVIAAACRPLRAIP